MKNATWTYAVYHGVCLLPAIIWGRGLWKDTVRRPGWRDCALLVVAAIIFSLIALGLFELFGNRMLSNDAVVELLSEQGFNKAIFWPLSFYAIVVNPIFEELFWRGVVFNELEKHKAPFKHFALIFSSLAYAAFHYSIFRLVLFPGWAELGTLMLAVYGAMLAIIYRKTGSIVTTALAHGLLTDLAVIVLIIDLLWKYPGLL